MAVMYGDKDLEAEGDRTLGGKNKCVNCGEPVPIERIFCDECLSELMQLGL